MDRSVNIIRPHHVDSSYNPRVPRLRWAWRAKRVNNHRILQIALGTETVVHPRQGSSWCRKQVV